MLKKLYADDAGSIASLVHSRAQEIPADVLAKAQEILADVRERKDEAVHDYTLKFDRQDFDNCRVSKEELEAQAAKADPAFVSAMEEAAQNIRQFHELQKQEGYELKRDDGAILGCRVIPLDSVGIYVPGGRALYPSSVLMNAIPAHIAGVRRIVMVSPSPKDGKIDPNLAAAAKAVGVDEIYKIGGAQAVAALAYGTETIDPVDKIVGPGNIYVAAAKKLVYGTVDIDMIAGPSEILVIADEKANPRHVAADLISQAEHDPMASAILVCTGEALGDAVCKELEIQSAALPRKEIIEQSLANYGLCIIADDLEQAVAISNTIAPEHLELQVEDPFALLPLVKNAGSVFMGRDACESIGDYFGGTNHVLPTSGTARFSSPLSVDAFIKKSQYLYYPKSALLKDGDKIMTMAHAESLDGHANAVKVRLDDER